LTGLASLANKNISVQFLGKAEVLVLTSLFQGESRDVNIIQFVVVVVVSQTV